MYDIDIEKLPNEFVQKCNYDCGNVVICNDKVGFGWNTAKKNFQSVCKKTIGLIMLKCNIKM